MLEVVGSVVCFIIWINWRYHDELNATWTTAYDKQHNDSHFGNHASNRKKPNVSKIVTGTISYSLYGSNPRYTDGALANAKLYKEIYPGWTMRVYYDDSVPRNILSQLEDASVEFISMTGSKVNKMSWRFQAAASAERSCSRDIDSRLSLREKAAVDEWIKSGKQFHVMRDHPAHARFAMSGGMWCSKTIPNMIELLRNVSNQKYLEDMNFLNGVIWPMAKKSLLQHDSFSCDKWGGGLPFPTKRVGWEHVGSVFINGQMRETDVASLKRRGVVNKCVKDNYSPLSSNISGTSITNNKTVTLK